MRVFPDYIIKYINLFGRFSRDFERLLAEIPRGVRQAHVVLVGMMYEHSRTADGDCFRFAERHINRPFRHEQVRPVLDAIYQTTRDQIIDYMDLSNLRARLTTFVDVPTSEHFSQTRHLSSSQTSPAWDSI